MSVTFPTTGGRQLKIIVALWHLWNTFPLYPHDECTCILLLCFGAFAKTTLIFNVTQHDGKFKKKKKKKARRAN